MRTEPAQQYPRGNELLRQVVNHILRNPDEWDQREWHCGTSHCVGGWARILGGHEPSNDATECFVQARKALELTNYEADWLFYPSRKLHDIYLFALAKVEGRAFFHLDGFGFDGRDRDGFSREGYGRDGFDRMGFDRMRLDRDGNPMPMPLLQSYQPEKTWPNHS